MDSDTEISSKPKRTPAKRGIYKCNICDKEFTLKGYLKQHVLIHTGHKPYPCKICSKGFTQSHHLINHMRIHNNEKPFICNICDKRFTQKHNLKRHIELHAGKTYECAECEKSFSEIYTLKRHVAYTHDQTLDKQERIRNQSTIDKPEKRRNRPKIYACSQCDKVYTQISHLKTHANLHAGIRFLCKLCNSSFAERGTLKNHIRTKHNKVNEEWKYVNINSTIQTESKSLDYTYIMCLKCNIKFKNKLRFDGHICTTNIIKTDGNAESKDIKTKFKSENKEEDVECNLVIKKEIDYYDGESMLDTNEITIKIEEGLDIVENEIHQDLEDTQFIKIEMTPIKEEIDYL